MSPRARSIVAALLGLCGGAWFAWQLPRTAKAAAMIPPTAMLLAAVASQLRRLGPQLLARGLWWSNLVLGVLLTFLGNRSESSMGLALTASCGAALMVADRRSLSTAADDAGFRPAAFGATIQLLLVLALADAQTLGLFAFIEMDAQRDAATLYVLVALGLLAGFAGLLRLALWGVALTMASSAVLAFAMVTEAVQTDRDLRVPLLAISGLQLVAPLPMLASMITRRRLPELPRGLRDKATTAVIGLVVLVTAACSLYWRQRR